MHPVQLIYSALDKYDQDKPEVPEITENGICAVTGIEGPTLPRKLLFGKSFTDGAVLAAPSSDRVSVEAYVALRCKWERMSSWICDGETFMRLDRVGVRHAVLSDPPCTSWCAYATTSYKKHGALRAPVNRGGASNIWLFENRIVDCSDNETITDWWGRLNKALRDGFSRPILESLSCPAHVMRKAGLRNWIEFESWAKPKRNSALYAFLCYLLPSQEELRSERKQNPVAGNAVSSSRKKSSIQEEDQ